MNEYVAVPELNDVEQEILQRLAAVRTHIEDVKCVLDECKLRLSNTWTSMGIIERELCRPHRRS